MRKNLPVTQNVYTFPHDQTLISITDLKGRITYCNASFVAVSGFTSEELLGQPHNIVRHPDMPEEAFRDMWDTIQNSLPWTGMIKNRRKNGDHYWVRANATPVRDGDTVVGFLSVRTYAPADEIERAEQLYARMRAEAEAGKRQTVLHRGRVVRRTLLGRLVALSKPGLAGRQTLLAGFAAALPIAAMSAGAPMWGGVLAGVIGTVVASIGLHRITIRPLQHVVQTANLLASGDLTRFINVTDSGEFGQVQLALAQLAVSVRTVVRDVRHEVANLLGGTQEIASGNQDLAARTDTQSNNLQQSAAAIEEIYDTIQQTSRLSEQGAQQATATYQVVDRGNTAVQHVADTMQEIATSSERIHDIIAVIESVAFQTNILALNAAVESARAGEHGRGFAVVASEVRALAQRTTGAAREVRELIQESGARVSAGEHRVVEARQRMAEVMDSVKQMAAVLDQINAAAQAQTRGVEHIKHGFDELELITQQNMSMVDELASAAHSLNSQVGAVHNTIRVFRLTEKDTTLAESDAVALRKAQGDKFIDEDGHINFSHELSKHQQARVMLRNAINRKLQVNENIGRDDCCALGVWLAGPGHQRHGQTPEHAELHTIHAAYHRELGRVALNINQKRFSAATAQLESGQPLHTTGQKLTKAVRNMAAIV
ncbi:methyl-accepting chemotaxis protein [Achromobacter sp. F4_2707]|uniref:methyl-accepting chemotaxis protein n=1 Tax=Achromobacter sp. F4_2707 TaxID=3114286 RepID=UPI0039C74736